MKTLQFKTHTIILFSGISNCGKSTFAKDILIPKIKEDWNTKTNLPDKLNLQYISSDEIRKDIMGNEGNFHKHDISSYYVSEQAFELLFTKLKAVTSFPVNAHYVIVDTTGLSEDFRNKVKDIARDNNYNLDLVLFDYKKRDDFFKYANDDVFVSKRVIQNHLKKFQENTLKTLNKKHYNTIHRFKSIDELTIDNIQVDLSDANDYSKYLLDDKHEYIIVGDTHACYDDLINLLENKHKITLDENGKLQYTYQEQKLIMIGDVIDKGLQTKQMIDFLYNNKENILFVKGNHENFVYKYLKNLIKDDKITQDLIDNYFDSIAIFENDEDLKNKFFEIVELSKEFFQSKYFIVCHAPAEQKYLGKISSFSLKYQRNLFLDKKQHEFENQKDYIEYLKEKLSYIYKTKHNSLKVVYGHLAFDDIYKPSNYIGIDTGCVYGNKLTSIMFKKYKDFLPSYNSISSIGNKKYSIADLIHINGHDTVASKEEYIELDSQDVRRMKWLIKNNVNYISGTMAPCDVKDMDIESLESGLEYYKKNGISEVVLQPKYMGSRCQVYLNCEDYTQSYATTRNGFVIKKENMKEKLLSVFEKLHKQFISEKSAEEKKYKWIIFDGEILPWSFLGKGFIDEHFNPSLYAVRNELQFLKDTNFENKLVGVSEVYIKENFKELSQLPNAKKELGKSLGDAQFETLQSYMRVQQQHSSIEESNNNLEVFKSQMDIFGSDGETYYKAFSILKIVESSGEEKIYNNFSLLNDNQKMYDILNKEKCIAVNLNEEDYLQKAQAYFDLKTVDENMEGLVLKPRFVFDEEHKYIAPYIKCRNKKYLTLVYGYDYLRDNKYKKLVAKKGTKNKLRTSIFEFNIGLRMLQTPYGIFDTKEYKRLIMEMIKEEKKEKVLDPRL